MQFLNPLFLVGCVSVVGPILVHLIRREESRKVPFSSLMFVKRVPKRSLRRQKIRHPLLLLLRIGALMILAFAFARPFLISQGSTPFALSTGRSIVLLIDNSFSMRAGDRFEKAKQLALQVVDSLSGGDTIQAILYSDFTQVLNQMQADKASLRSLILQSQAGYHKTSHPIAFRLAQQLLSTAPHARREIHWITDLQQTGWTDGKECSIGEDVQLVTHNVAGEETNLSVGQVQLRNDIGADGQFIRLSAHVGSFGAQTPHYSAQSPRGALVSLTLNEKKLEEKNIAVGANTTSLIEFNRFVAPTGLSRGEVKIEANDSLPQDNVFHFTLNSLHKTRILLVSDDGGSDNYYLSKALAPSKSSSFQAESQNPRPELDLSKYAAVVLNNLGVVPVKLARSLDEFVTLGGGLITVLGPRTRPAELNKTLASLLPARLLENTSGSTSKGQRLIGEIQREHPVFDIFKPVHHSYFMTTQFSRVIQSAPGESSEILVKLEDATPLLLARTVGKGRSLLFTSSLNMDWNDLPTKSVFLPLVHQMLKYSTSLFEEDRHYLVVGDTVPMSILNPMLGKALNKIVGGSFSQSWKVIAPSGSSIELGDRQLVTAPFFSLQEPGFYTSRVHNLDHAIAVNIPDEETDLRGTAPEKLAALIQRIPAATKQASRLDSVQSSKESVESKQRIWWYLLISAILLLAVESFLSNRYYKGVSEN